MPTADAAGWQRLLAAEVERAIALGRPADQVGDLAYETVITEWHAQNGAKPRPGHCVGCDAQLGPDRFIAMPGVQTCPGGAALGCLARFGRRWRGAAVAALRDLGVVRPPPPPKTRKASAKPPRVARAPEQLGLQLDTVKVA